jgi:hypothetical protein
MVRGRTCVDLRFSPCAGQHSAPAAEHRTALQVGRGWSLLCAGVSAPAAPVDEAGALEEIGVFKPVDFSPGSATRSQRVALDSRDSKPRWPLAMTCESWLIANPGEVPRECRVNRNCCPDARARRAPSSIVAPNQTANNNPLKRNGDVDHSRTAGSSRSVCSAQLGATSLLRRARGNANAPQWLIQGNRVKAITGR